MLHKNPYEHESLYTGTTSQSSSDSKCTCSSSGSVQKMEKFMEGGGTDDLNLEESLEKKIG